MLHTSTSLLEYTGRWHTDINTWLQTLTPGLFFFTLAKFFVISHVYCLQLFLSKWWNRCWYRGEMGSKVVHPITLIWPSLHCPFLALPYNCTNGSGSAGQRSRSGEYNMGGSLQRSWKMKKKCRSIHFFVPEHIFYFIYHSHCRNGSKSPVINETLFPCNASVHLEQGFNILTSMKNMNGFAGALQYNAWTFQE